ncbi:MAG: serine/threonine protein kinase [Acidobacteriaceae bacterium]|nr:serine/threonine protein kinase [Acidobacteriaceae bacterium]
MDAHPKPDDSEPTVTIESPTAHQDSSLGPYRLLRKIGEGGMGVVFHARQVDPIRRDVAVKLIKPGMDTKQVVARFESERQALAMMDHPNIARVFEAGAAEGRPYFVMELVDGIPITRYCQAKRLTIRERLELFIPVCRAIQHAHQKGIIHRDIKPSNILIAEHEGRPTPKVIDFGLAKALGHELSDASAMTNVGAVVGTLDYMSPEQADFIRQDIDTRSDVYSLGVVLYELLTGTTPLRCDRAAGTAYLDALQRVRTEESPRPSMRMRESTSTSEMAAEFRSDPARITKLLEGDLDWITMKALEKDRARRYETVNALARDLERHLAGEPVEAGPPSAGYRLKKFAGRHRRAIAIAASLLILLVSAVLVSSWMAIRARRAEREAQAVINFLKNDVLEQASTYHQKGTKPDLNLTVRTALDRAAARIDGKFPGQPLVEATIRSTIASTYTDLGLFADAERQFERVLALRRRELGEKHPDTLSTLSNLAATYERAGKLQDAETAYRKVAEIEERTLGATDPKTLKSKNGLAVTYAEQGKYPQAESIFAVIVPLMQKKLGEENSETLMAMGNLGAVYDLRGKYALAEPLFLKTLEIKRRILGDDNPDTLDTRVNLAGLYAEMGDLSKSETLMTQAAAAFRRVLGDTHPHTLQAGNSLAQVYALEGKYAQAESIYSKVFETARRTLGDQRPVTMESMNGLAGVYRREGKLAQAETLYSKVADLRRRVLGADNPDALGSMVALGRVQVAQRKFTDAESTLAAAWKESEKTWANKWERFECENLLGAAMAGQQKFSEAEPLLLSGYEGMRQRESEISVPERSNLSDAKARIVKFYQQWGKPDKASAWAAQ